MTNIVVIAKVPTPGRVKTRLCPPCSPSAAAAIARAALEDTLESAAGAVADRHLLALDGEAPAWLRADWEIIPQGDGPLDRRLATVFGTVRGPAFLVGMDTPQLATSQVDAALADVDGGTDAVLGLASDGGWWGMGLAEPSPAAVRGVPMSAPDTGDRQLARLRRLGLDVRLLAELRDVDTWPDAIEVASLVPTSRFAAAVADVDTALSADAAR